MKRELMIGDERGRNFAAQLAGSGSLTQTEDNHVHATRLLCEWNLIMESGRRGGGGNGSNGEYT
jgi:hypothetical protein